MEARIAGDGEHQQRFHHLARRSEQLHKQLRDRFHRTLANTGVAVGTLTVGNLNIVPGSIFDYDIASPSSGDLLNVTGSVTGDGAVFNLYVPGTTTPLDTAGTYNLISETGGYTGGESALSIGDLPADLTASFATGSNGDLQVTLAPVPEPGTAGLAAIAGCTALLRRRRVIRA